MRNTLLQGLRPPVTEAAPRNDDPELAALAASVMKAAERSLGRSLAIRHVDAGSCNGCELEIHALSNAFYDLERFGFRFVASPRHADVLLVMTSSPNGHFSPAAAARFRLSWIVLRATPRRRPISRALTPSWRRRNKCRSCRMLSSRLAGRRSRRPRRLSAASASSSIFSACRRTPRCRRSACSTRPVSPRGRTSSWKSRSARRPKSV